MKHKPAGPHWWEPRRLNVADIVQRSGYDRVTIWRKRRNGDFPRPVVEGRRPLWDSEDIDEWLKNSRPSPAWEEAAQRFWQRAWERGAKLQPPSRLDVLLMVEEMWDDDDRFNASRREDTENGS